MNITSKPFFGRRWRGPGRQRGVVLLFSLIALAVMMIASVALVRSFNTTLANAGNIAFKRDMRNQAELAIAQVLANMRAHLNTPAARAANVPSRNYSAVNQPTNRRGIPTVLLNKETFDPLWTAGTMIVRDGDVEIAHIRYLVDRLCDEPGVDNVLGPNRCQIVDAGKQGGSGSHLNRAEDASIYGSTTSMMIVYRVTVRVDTPPNSPRDTQAFYQATFTQ